MFFPFINFKNSKITSNSRKSARNSKNNFLKSTNKFLGLRKPGTRQKDAVPVGPKNVLDANRQIWLHGRLIGRAGTGIDDFGRERKVERVRRLPGSAKSNGSSIGSVQSG